MIVLGHVRGGRGILVAPATGEAEEQGSGRGLREAVFYRAFFGFTRPGKGEGWGGHVQERGFVVMLG